MGIEDQVYHALTGQARNRGETFGDLLGEAKGRYGSVRAAARAYGVPESSWRRWAKGANPKAGSAEKVARGSRSDRLVDGPTDQSLVIKAKDRHDGRVRTISAEKLKLVPGTMDKVREAYLRGDDAGAARELLAGIGDRWYREWLTPGSTAARTGTSDGLGGGPEAAAQRTHRAPENPRPSAGGGGGGGGIYEAYEDEDSDWQDLQYEGDDVDSDYGADVIGAN